MTKKNVLLEESEGTFSTSLPSITIIGLPFQPTPNTYSNSYISAFWLNRKLNGGVLQIKFPLSKKINQDTPLLEQGFKHSWKKCDRNLKFQKLF